MTPAIDLVRAKKITFKVHQYQHDPTTNSYGDEAAKALDTTPAQIFKTLVVETNTGELVVGVVPVSSMLDLKSIASATGAKKASMADKIKVQRTSGYVVGGVSPIAQRRQLTTVIDSTANNFETVLVSGGKRGLDIELSAADLAKLTKAFFADISTA